MKSLNVWIASLILICYFATFSISHCLSICLNIMQGAFI